MPFFKLESEEHTGRVSVAMAERVAGPGFTLDAALEADRGRTAAGWRFFPSLAAFLVTPEVQAAQAGLLRTLLEDRGVDLAVLEGQVVPDAPEPADGDHWVQPLGVLGAYPEGATVTHQGKTWVSLVAANVWAPGVSGWREATAEPGGPAAWVQPTGAHDAYKKGDRVTFEGAVWVSSVDANVWAPGVYGWAKE